MLSFNATPSKKLLSLVTFASVIFAISSASYLRADDDFDKPSRTDRIVSQLVARLMKSEHLSSRPLDDTISLRAFDLYIKSLDPLKSYFLQSDIDEFAQWKLQIDDQMKNGEYEAAFTVFKRFLQRVDQRTELAIELIDTDHDFTLDEDIVTDPDLLQFAKTEDEARENWRKRIKYSMLVLRVSDQDDQKKKDEQAGDDEDQDSTESVDPKERLRKRYRSFARRMHQFDTEDVVERYVTAITSSYDPHTSYMSKKSFENFLISIGLELEGIGATLQETDDGYTIIKNIVAGGAAATQGGLKVNDKIIAVAQGEDDGSNADKKLFEQNGGDYIDATGMRLDNVVGMIRGKAGTTVRLSVRSEKEGEHTVKIIREKIKLEDSAAHGEIFEQGTKPDGTPNKIGVIELPSFYANMRGDKNGRSTTRDVRKILDGFTKDGVDAVILDLRFNGGGSLKEAIDCTGLFIDSGPVVQVKNSYGDIEKLNDEDRGAAWEKPLVVLTNRFSASASEILAGAVQDYHRGLVIGDTTTHGKGTVQSLMDLNRILYPGLREPPNYFGALKITTQQFYRPNGDSTQKRGVLSDLVLPSFTDKMDVSESDLDYPVEFDRVPRASFTLYPFSGPEIIEALQSKSQDRMANSKKFQESIEKIGKYVEQKNLKTISLNEEKFTARRKELIAEKEDEKVIEDQLSPNKKIERNFYLDEVLQITAEYMNLLSKKG